MSVSSPASDVARDKAPRRQARRDAPRGSAAARAWADWKETHRLWRLGVRLGWLDIRLRYRGSALGPFWLTITSALMVASMGVLYSRLFHMQLATYLPFLSLSLTLWAAGLSSLIQESCTCFLDAEDMVRSVQLPLLLYAVRVVVRNAIVFAHNIIVPLGVFALYHLWPGMNAILAIPALLLWALDGFAACMLFGSLCARFRDISPIIGAFLQIVFYVTPIIWMPQQLGAKASLLLYNPFYPLLEIVRAPLLGHVPSFQLWAIALGVSAVFWAIAVRSFIRTRARLVFWL
ncbi:ABC transporter permease [Gluconobacter kanchanaburiensis]|uniref:Sugar ABC transporter permease n=1 Tax=Gluconobacter kanchanaburiensis NBRC 103587 TaxID=1307948 RepID=A0A511B9U7_9PROT|nr:ABC transporter permease [Gluconobacter kanchanaburiensis]MBF0862880.1 ABC transporter permease [Gluconobacter kanchanaburiensis]GBR72004.1 polysaccharide/O-antigen exporter permease [Gluconobacter kanchanaburiensis NBRC 103587]GEK97195.1 sugar ABC transporter permease [Gluconobacter kanchanaburiensis NBRC 103587]